MARVRGRMMEPIRLQDLLQGIPHRTINLAGQTIVSGVCTDTRKLAHGELFVALRGEKSDGLNYIPQALEIGAFRPNSRLRRGPSAGTASGSTSSTS